MTSNSARLALRTSFLLAFSLFTSVLVAAPTNSIFNPLLPALQTLFNGQGLIQGALGSLGGLFGVQKTYDYVVVGGGTAGNTIAYRLAEAGNTVAVIEAGFFLEISKPVFGTTPSGAIFSTGSAGFEVNPLVDWGFSTEPTEGTNGRKLHYARGKCLGGSSSLNFMAYHRGSKGTYQKWADDVGDQSYTLDNMMQHFQKSVHFTPPNDEDRGNNISTAYNEKSFAAQGGPISVAYPAYVPAWMTWIEKGYAALGLKRTSGFDDGDLLGYHYLQETIHAKEQYRASSTEFVYEAQRKNIKTLQIYTQTLAEKIIFDVNKRATGVRVQSFASPFEYNINAAKEVIVSAGAFQSPQLLMVSGVGPKSLLQQNSIKQVVVLPGVGQNMWDHVTFGLSYEVNVDTINSILDPIAITDSLLQYGTKSTGIMTSMQIDMLGWEKLPESYRKNFSPETKGALAEFPSDWPEVEFLPVNGYVGTFSSPLLEQPLTGKQYAGIATAIVAPLSRGNISISSGSTIVPPIINTNFLSHKADQELAVAMFKRVRDLASTSVMKDVIVGDEVFPGPDVQTDEQMLNAIRNGLMTVWHAAGTCKMGKSSDEMAVIDSKARVFGVEGLRVVDASAFPLLPPGHPQSTVYALAEKIAHEIINEI